MDPNATQPPSQEVPQQPSVNTQILQNQDQGGNKKKYILISVITIVFLLVISAVVYIFMNMKDKKIEKEKIVITPTPILQENAKPTLAPFPSVGISNTSIIISYKIGKTPDDLKGTKRFDEILELFSTLGVESQVKIENFNPNLPDTSYTITFREGVNIEEAAKTIYELPEIDHAEPNAIVELYN